MRKLFLPLLFCFAWSAAAQTFADELDDHFKLLDKNGDGKMSREESKIWGWPNLKFEWADIDNDGFIRLDEFKSWLTAKKVRERMLRLNEEAFRQMDADRDGRISYRDECWCTEDLFRKLDLNKDGYLPRAEAFQRSKSKLRVVKQKSKKNKK